MTRSLSSRNVDSVFADILEGAVAGDLQDNRLDQMAAAGSRGELQTMLEEIRGHASRRRFQTLLDGVAGSSFGSFRANADLVATINAIGAALGVGFKLKGTDIAVRVRCVNPPRSKEGSVQARTADRRQKVAYSGAEMPALELVVR